MILLKNKSRETTLKISRQKSLTNFNLPKQPIKSSRWTISDLLTSNV